MVDISEKVREIKRLVDDGKYFVINRARQYGKTTTIDALARFLTATNYSVLSLDFQRISEASFKTEEAFVKAFARSIFRKSKIIDIPNNIVEKLSEFIERKEEKAVLDELFDTLSDWCDESNKPVVLLIDEVDSATNNQVFLDFLGLLRDGYISRDTKGIQTFQSVILAGVTDIKHMRNKIRDEAEHRVNSPWNIAADFDIDMSLSEVGIKGMLDDYENDHHTGMDTAAMAKSIREYTNGYPFLVSKICQTIDTKLVPEKLSDLNAAWTENGFTEAIKIILSENNNSLFNSLMGKLTNYPKLRNSLRAVLMKGETLTWLPYDEEQQQLFMYGFIRNNNNSVAVSNRIFEMLLYAHFIGENNQNDDLRQIASEMKSAFVETDGSLNIPKIMEHFIKEHNRIHGDNTEKFLEAEGRERFITYVSAIINGTGTYSIEEQTRDQRRMDLVIHYLGRRYIIELKIWRGERYNSEGEQQIIDYLNYWGLNTGYMLSFSFNRNKQSGVKQVRIGEKILYEGIV